MLKSQRNWLKISVNYCVSSVADAGDAQSQSNSCIFLHLNLCGPSEVLELRKRYPLEWFIGGSKTPYQHLKPFGSREVCPKGLEIGMRKIAKIKGVIGLVFPKNS